MVSLLIFTGMRRAELCGLEWSDIDFEHALIHIQRTSQYIPKQGIIEDLTKNNSSQRAVAVSGSVLSMLRVYKAHQAEQRLKLGSAWNPAWTEHPRLFTQLDGTPINPDSVTKWFHAFIARSDLPPIHIHSLRHPYVKHTTKIFSLRLMDFQAQAYPDARRKTRGACQLLRVGQSRSPVRPLCNRKRFSCLPPQSKMSWILYAISMRLSGYTSTRSISSSASSVVSVSASKIALDAFLRLSCRACSSFFCFACANTAA